MFTVGKIDIEKYKCIAKNIITDEVIITDRQIEHIKERHPNDFELYNKYFGDIVQNPDYILEANRPNTALILKNIIAEGKQFKTVLRLAVAGDITSDGTEPKNSVITFIKIDQKEWNRLIKKQKNSLQQGINVV